MSIIMVSASWSAGILPAVPTDPKRPAGRKPAFRLAGDLFYASPDLTRLGSYAGIAAE